MAVPLPTLSESTLCEKCSVLSFDDKALGGYVKKDKSGREYLSFDKVPDGRNNLRPNWRRFQKDRDVDSYKWSEWNLNLKYEHTDHLPDLPLLKASAESGCMFCAALRDATLALNSGNTGTIDYRLVYKGKPHNPTLEGIGLYMLQAYCLVTESTSKHRDRSRLVLLVNCEDGWFTVDVLGSGS